MTDVQGRCPACRGASLFLGEGGHVTCARLDCPNPSAAETRSTDRAETDYDRLIAAGAPPEHAARYAENGVHTPGCDCGHEGMGAAWHDTACAWRTGLKPAPAAAEATDGPDTITDPEWLRQQYARALTTAFDTFDPEQTEDAYLAEHLADAVLAVRDRHLQQLRQRLALAADLAGTVQAATQRYEAEQGSEVSALEALGYHAMGQAIDIERVQQQRDQLAESLRAEVKMLCDCCGDNRDRMNRIRELIGLPTQSYKLTDDEE